MGFESYTNPDNTIVTGELTVRSNPRLGLTGVSFDNGLIVSDGLGDIGMQNLIAQNITANGTFTAPNFYGGGYTVFNVKAYGAKGDNSHDDTTAIQTAINAANVSGGIVFLPQGTYKTSACLNVGANAAPSNALTFMGSGTRTSVIKPVSGANFDVISSTYPISNTAVLHGPDRMWLHDFGIDGSNMTGTTAGQGNGIHMFAATYCKISDISFQSIPNWAILIDCNGNGDSYNNLIENCHTNSCAGGLFFAGTGEGSTVRHNFFFGAHNTTAANQDIYNNSHTPTNVGNAMRHVFAGDNQVIGNFFGGGLRDLTHELVYINGTEQFLYNQFDNVEVQSIKVDGSAAGTVIGYNLFESVQYAPGVECINLKCNNCTIVGNFAFNYGVGYDYAIRETQANTGNIIANNQFYPGSSGMFLFNSNSINTTNSNRGYNPVGPITPPSVPSTTVAYTNKFCVDCTVFITGGTVTVIAIGGTTTGLTSGPFRVPAGQTITLTYSVAPTWTWFGD